MKVFNTQLAKVNQKGFTLTELMIVVAIIGILASIALPNYTQYIIRANRAAAQSEMLAIANRQEQYLLANRDYADKSIIESSGYSLPLEVGDKYSYAIAIGAGVAPSYTITFTPSGSQSVDGNLTLNNAGAKTPTDKW